MLFRKWESWFVYGCSVAALLGSAMTPVSASITYFDPADITINNQSDVRLDLDGDGFDDLSFSHSTSFITLVLEDASSTVRGVNGSGVVGSGGDAALLSAGTLVGPGSTVSGGADNTFAAFNDNLLNLFGSGSNDGQWWGGGAGVGGGYLGFMLAAADGAHYGWMRLSIADYAANDTSSLDITIHDYAYETVAGQFVLTGLIGVQPSDGTVPVPPVLGLFTVGLAALRRTRR
ncbi:MAG: hypothetical protein H6926_05260 [Chromatiales bacterium]|nr:hypothetical protein [Chromatiales bacterium]